MTVFMGTEFDRTIIRTYGEHFIKSRLPLISDEHL